MIVSNKLIQNKIIFYVSISFFLDDQFEFWTRCATQMAQTLWTTLSYNMY